MNSPRTRPLCVHLTLPHVRPWWTYACLRLSASSSTPAPPPPLNLAYQRYPQRFPRVQQCAHALHQVLSNGCSRKRRFKQAGMRRRCKKKQMRGERGAISGGCGRKCASFEGRSCNATIILVHLGRGRRQQQEWKRTWYSSGDGRKASCCAWRMSATPSRSFSYQEVQCAPLCPRVRKYQPCNSFCATEKNALNRTFSTHV